MISSHKAVIRRRYRFAIIATLYFCVSAGTSSLSEVANAATTVEKPLADAAKKLALELKSQKISELKLVVREPVQLSSSLPNTIREVVGGELRAAGITLVKSSARRIIKVAARIVDEPARAAFIDVEFTLLNESGQELLKLPLACKITGTSKVAPALGLPIDGSHRETGQSRPIGPGHVKNVLPGSGGPKASVRNSIIRAHRDGMFGLELLVNGRSCEATVDAAGYPFVDLRNGETYEVRLINDGNFDVLVALTIDGVDSGWFSKSRKVLWLVRKGRSASIQGWLTPTGGARFEIAPPNEAVAATLGQIGDVGVIQASFYRAYAPGDVRDPQDKGSGTARGDEFEWEVQSVNLQRGAKLRAVIPVRYGKE